MSQPTLYGNEHPVIEDGLQKQVDHAVDTYNMTMKSEPDTSVHPEWVKAVSYAIRSGKEDTLKLPMWAAWVYPAYEKLKGAKTISTSDEIKKA